MTIHCQKEDKMALMVMDVLNIVENRAQWCRENGESDMRNIIHLTQSIRKDLNDGKSRGDILKYWEMV